MASSSQRHSSSSSQSGPRGPRRSEFVTHHSRQLTLPQDVIRYIKIKTTRVAKAITNQGVDLDFEAIEDGTHICIIKSAEVNQAKEVVRQNVAKLVRQSFQMKGISCLSPTTVISKLRHNRVFVGFFFYDDGGRVDICSDTDENVSKAFDLIKELQIENLPNPVEQCRAKTSVSAPAMQLNRRQVSCSSSDESFQDKLELEIEKLRYLNATSELKEMKKGAVSINVNTLAGCVEVSGKRPEVFSVIEKLHELTSSYVTNSIPRHGVFLKCFKSVKHADVIGALRATHVQAGWDCQEAALLLCSDSEASIEKAVRAIEGLILESDYPAQGSLSRAQIERTEVDGRWFALSDRLKKANVELAVDYNRSKIIFALPSARSDEGVKNQLDKFFSTHSCQLKLDTAEIEKLFLLNKNAVENSCVLPGETLSITVSNLACLLASNSQKGLSHARKQIEAMIDRTASSSVEVEKRGLIKWLLSADGRSRLDEISSLCQVSYKTEGKNVASSSIDANSDRLVAVQADIAQQTVDGILVGNGELCRAMESSCGATIKEGYQRLKNNLTGLCCDVYLVDLPSWRNESSLQQLNQVVESALKRFSDQMLATVSLPAIGTGGLGYPKKKVAETMVTSVEKFLEANHLTSIQKVYFVSDEDDMPMAVEFINAIGQLPRLSLPTVTNQSQVVTFTALTKEKATDAASRLNSSLSDSLAKIVWTKSPHRLLIPRLSPAQIAKVQDKARKHNVEVRVSSDDIEIEGLKADVFDIRDTIDAELVHLAGKQQCSIPDTWTLNESGQYSLLVKVDSTKAEYSEVETFFLQTCPGYAVRDIEIQRVQNVQLYKMYEAWKEKVEKEVGGERVVERRLWHGTDAESVESICKNEFNRSFAGKNATVYGQGSYFSTTSGYSIGYSKGQGDKCMFLAQVVTGRYTSGSSSMTRKSLPQSYHSTVNDVSSPSIFVVYNDASAYPQYVIKFKC